MYNVVFLKASRPSCPSTKSLQVGRTRVGMHFPMPKPTKVKIALGTLIPCQLLL